MKDTREDTQVLLENSLIHNFEEFRIQIGRKNMTRIQRISEEPKKSLTNPVRIEVKTNM